MQQEVGMGNELVRPPRYMVAGDERDAAMDVILKLIETRPKM